jgi:hypothetical protein
MKGMKVHRAATLVVMMLLAVLTLGLLMIAAAGGIGFSWKRYSRR